MGCGPHKNQDDTEEKPTGERMMRVKVLDEKVRGEVETQKGGDTKKEKPAAATSLSKFLSLVNLENSLQKSWIFLLSLQLF